MSKQDVCEWRANPVIHPNFYTGKDAGLKGFCGPWKPSEGAGFKGKRPGMDV
jgi:hypothetical protein